MAKLQQQQHQSGTVARSNRFDEASLYQKEVFDRKLRTYLIFDLEKQNDKCIVFFAIRSL